MLAACSFMVGTYALLFLARSFFHADPATALHAARTVSRTRDLPDMRLLTVPRLSTRSVMVLVGLSSDYCSWYLQVLTTLALMVMVHNKYCNVDVLSSIFLIVSFNAHAHTVIFLILISSLLLSKNLFSFSLLNMCR